MWNIYHNHTLVAEHHPGLCYLEQWEVIENDDFSHFCVKDNIITHEICCIDNCKEELLAKYTTYEFDDTESG